MKNKLLYLPLLAFLALVLMFAIQLTFNAKGDDPKMLESALIGQPMPEFRLESLQKEGEVVDADLFYNGKPLLLNVWATWCPTCRAEHKYLNTLADKGVAIVGINYKDDRQKAIAWLTTLGNPYLLDLYDADGMLGLDLGVYGAPETFLIDGKGIVRYRHAGDMNDTIWQKELLPLYLKYGGELIERIDEPEESRNATHKDRSKGVAQ